MTRKMPKQLYRNNWPRLRFRYVFEDCLLLHCQVCLACCRLQGRNYLVIQLETSVSSELVFQLQETCEMKTEKDCFTVLKKECIKSAHLSLGVKTNSSKASPCGYIDQKT